MMMVAKKKMIMTSMKNMKSNDFVFKASWIKDICSLPLECQDKTILAIVSYGTTGNVHDSYIDEHNFNLLRNIANHIDGQRKFYPPSIEEVSKYIEEKNFNVDPVKWWNFYDSKGWMIGKNKMKNWRSAVATWNTEKTNKSDGNIYVRKVSEILQ